MKKTKIQIFSDIHGEGYADPAFIWKFVQPKAPIAVVAGDINARNFEEQVTEIAKKFKLVICTLGNHEWYKRDIVWRPDPALMPSNVVILDQKVHETNEIIFIGTTLWTDFKSRDWFVMHAAKDHINDFHLIRAHNYGVKFTPHMAADKHEREKNWLKVMIENNRDKGKKIVVVTHFMPTYALVHSRWKTPGTETLNHYFAANCEDVLGMNGIDAWIFGHTHDYRDMKIGDLRCVCNPLGYPKENTNFKNKVILV
jgi:predicted phosphodiesterase